MNASSKQKPALYGIRSIWHLCRRKRIPLIIVQISAINATYPSVRETWKLKDVTDIASQGSIDGNLYVYTNTAGVVHGP